MKRSWSIHRFHAVCALVLLLSLGMQNPPTQNVTERYNIGQERSDFFDGQGRMIGFAKENLRLNRMEYFDSTGTLMKYIPLSGFFRTPLRYSTGYRSRGVTLWNERRQRYDVLDSAGTVIGYFKYDRVHDRWEFLYGSM